MEGSASETSPAKRAGMVLVAGAGGFLGQGITAALVSEGWQVRGLLRTPAKTDLVRRIGAEPFLGDVLDPASLRRCVEGCDAVIHVAAAYPGPGVSPELARKVRVEGTRNLASAARSAGARRLLVGSGYWVYADQPGVLEDDSSLDPRGESQVNYEAERAGLESAVPRELEVVVGTAGNGLRRRLLVPRHGRLDLERLLPLPRPRREPLVPRGAGGRGKGLRYSPRTREGRGGLPRGR